MRMRIKAPTAEYNNNGVFCAHRPGDCALSGVASSVASHDKRCRALSVALLVVRRIAGRCGPVMAELTVAACMPHSDGHKDTKKRIYAVLWRQMEL